MGEGDGSEPHHQFEQRLARRRGEIFDIHTYEPVPLEPARKADRAIVVGEYGGVGWPVPDHLWKPAMRNWGSQTYQDQAAYIAALQKKVDVFVVRTWPVPLANVI